MGGRGGGRGGRGGGGGGGGGAGGGGGGGGGGGVGGGGGGGGGGPPPPPSISRWEREMCTDCLPVCTVREREMKKSQGIRIFQVLKSPNTYVLEFCTT